MTPKITCLADILAHTPRVRVIKENDENYWKEFDIALHNYEDKEVTIISNHIYDYVRYQYSEIQFLTPVQYEWRYIGLGDNVSWGEVYSYMWYVWEWWNILATGEYKTMYFYNEEEAAHESFKPLHQLTPKIELSTEEMIAELQRRGVVTEGKIINN